MIRYRYKYKTHITFSENIFSHHFLLRGIPMESESQKIIQSECSVMPGDQKSFGLDTFGNTVVSGYIGEYHNFFEFSSEGIVDVYQNKISEKLNPLFLYSSKLTQSMSNVSEICSTIRFSESQSVHEKIFIISNEISKALAYMPGVTSVHTSADDALKIGKGVCQDFAHVMIAVCRNFGIAARYVNGFMEGEGYTHAWIEYYCKDAWYGFDPTHNRPADPGYIKLAHGRDYEDCALDKGVFKGLTQQKLEVYLKVEQIQQ
ncbi:MAG: transglutaminase family protein [Paludibacter sp.]|nr:transglutaminase family protein [Paludibacter sp.]